MSTKQCRNWGPWKLDRELLVLRKDTQIEWYEVDLERCLSSAEMLDWIFQVNGHGWSEDNVAGLINALRDLLRPQSNLCSSGQNKTLTKGQVAKLVSKFKTTPDQVSTCKSTPVTRSISIRRLTR